jgi:hypothetical protein
MYQNPILIYQKCFFDKKAGAEPRVAIAYSHAWRTTANMAGFFK